MTKELAGKEAYLPLDQLDTAFRRTRLGDLGYKVVAVGAAGPDDPTRRQFMWMNRISGLAVMETREMHEGKVWHHISASCEHRQPTWDEMSAVKRDFMGDHVEAYMIHPPATRFINIDSKVLHWFSCMDQPDGVLPDFRISGSGPDGSVGI